MSTFLAAQADTQGRLAELGGRITCRRRVYWHVCPKSSRSESPVHCASLASTAGCGDQVERTGQVRGDHLVPVGGVERLQAPVPDICAGVADQDVDRFNRGVDLVDDGPDRGPVGDIAGRHKGRVAPLGRSTLVRFISRVPTDQSDASPISAKVFAIPRPIPLPAPVTKAVFKVAATMVSSSSGANSDHRLYAVKLLQGDGAMLIRYWPPYWNRESLKLA